MGGEREKAGTLGERKALMFKRKRSNPLSVRHLILLPTRADFATRRWQAQPLLGQPISPSS